MLSFSVGIAALWGNSDVDGLRPDAPPASWIDTGGGLIALNPSFPVIEAHLSRRFPPGGDHFDQAGTGGARSRAIRAKICPSTCRETATSANWKVM